MKGVDRKSRGCLKTVEYVVWCGQTWSKSTRTAKQTIMQNNKQQQRQNQQFKRKKNKDPPKSSSKRSNFPRLGVLHIASFVRKTKKLPSKSLDFQHFFSQTENHHESSKKRYGVPCRSYDGMAIGSCTRYGRTCTTWLNSNENLESCGCPHRKYVVIHHDSFLHQSCRSIFCCIPSYSCISFT